MCERAGVHFRRRAGVSFGLRCCRQRVFCTQPHAVLSISLYKPAAPKTYVITAKPCCPHPAWLTQATASLLPPGSAAVV